MQDKNRSSAKTRLLELASFSKVKGIRGLANYLGVPDSSLYSWISRDSIGDKSAILKKIPNVRIEWLESGEGEMFCNDTERPLEDDGGYIAAVAAMMRGMDADTQKDIFLSVQKEKLLRELLEERQEKKAG